MGNSAGWERPRMARERLGGLAGPKGLVKGCKLGNCSGALSWSGMEGVNRAPAAPALLEGSPPKKETPLPGRESCLFCN